MRFIWTEYPEFNYDDLWWERSIRSVANVTPLRRRGISPWSDLPEFRRVRGTPLAQANTALRRLSAGGRVGLVCVNDVECGTCRTFQLLDRRRWTPLLASRSPTPPATALGGVVPRQVESPAGMEPQVRAADV